MVSRSIIVLSLLLATGHGAASAASSSSSPPRQLRASSRAAASASTSGKDIPDVVSMRSLQEKLDVTNNSTDRAIDTTTVQIPTDCLNLLAATANENQKLKKANFFVFTDSMSNGYYSFNNMTKYSDLPMTNKFGFVTLSCQCHAFGGRGNCCQGDRAKLDVTGIDDPESMSTQMKEFVKDICTITSDSIGDNKLPPTGELPTTARPTTSVSPSEAPSTDSLSKSPTRAPTTVASTEAPTASPEQNIPEVIAPPNGSTGGTNRTGEGLSPGGWAGLALAGACILTIMLYLVSGPKKDEGQDVETRLVNYNAPDLDDMSLGDSGKELLTITTNCEMQSDCPPRIESPDATNSMTASDVSSLPSVSSGNHNRSEYYANHSLLPRPDEESVLSSSDEDGPSFFNDRYAGIEEGVEVSDSHNLSAILNSSGASQGSDNLDHAIESGNWEAVAASAAAIVKQNESSAKIGGTMSV